MISSAKKQHLTVLGFRNSEQKIRYTLKRSPQKGFYRMTIPAKRTWFQKLLRHPAAEFSIPNGTRFNHMIMPNGFPLFRPDDPRYEREVPETLTLDVPNTFFVI